MSNFLQGRRRGCYRERQGLHPGHRRAGGAEHEEDRPQPELRVRQAAIHRGTREKAQGTYIAITDF